MSSGSFLSFYGQEQSIYEADLETALLIAQLAQQDLEELTSACKGKGRADKPRSDHEIALEIQNEQLNEWRTFLEDAKLARSIGAALQTDQNTLNAFSIMEEAAVEDHRVAEILSQGGDLPEPTPTQKLLEDPALFVETPPSHTVGATPNQVDRQDSTHKGIGEAAITPSRNISQTPAAGPSIDRHKRVACTVCNDYIRFQECLHTSCDHHYCRDCIISLVEAFTRDESLFPLRCCQQPIPPEQASTFLNARLRSLFDVKLREFGTPAQTRVYCVLPTCSAFLGSSEAVAAFTAIRCPQCQSLTCSSCKQAGHDAGDCSENATVKELKALALAEHWQTCPGCHAIVELQHGCYHMTCRCHTQFCYLCAVPWKNCGCDQWDDRRLLVAAEQRVENEVGVAVRVEQPLLFRELVQQRARTLHENHECVSHVWDDCPRGTCGECGIYYHYFLKICRNCSRVACKRCTRNRL